MTFLINPYRFVTGGGGPGPIPTVPANGGYFNEIGSTSSPQVSRPTGFAAGDHYYVFIGTEDSAINTITNRPTADWSAVSATGLSNPVVDTTGADMRGFLERRVMAAGGPGTYTWDMSTSLWTSVGGILVRGGGDPELAVVESQAIVGGVSSARIPAITTTEDNRLLIAFVWTYENGPANDATGWSEPTGSTRMVFYKNMVTAGTSPAQAISNAVGASRWASVVLAIPPA